MIKSKIIILTPSKDDSIYNQTIDLFEQVSNYFNSIIRIWIYVPDIDNNYLDFSNARNFIFNKYGYVPGKRTFVSTCVESKTAFKLKLLLIPKIKQNQISFIDLPLYLPHTNIYNVSFERGNKIEFGNCTHYYISGTASIDSDGNILYKGDIIKQTKRICLIIKKMLNKHLINMDDILCMKWYIRNEDDINIIKNEINKIKYFNKNIDIYFEQAKICRPDWLTEAECFAVSKIGNHEFEDFSYEI